MEKKMICKNCGKEITKLLINQFNYDGSDSYICVNLDESDDETFTIQTTQNWTGYDLSDEERPETIKCPICKKYPFKSMMMGIYEPVIITFWN